MSDSSDPLKPSKSDDSIIIPQLIQSADGKSLEESNSLRERVYATLRTHIPAEYIIDAVEGWQPRTPIIWTDENGQCVDLSSVQEGQSVYATAQKRKLSQEELAAELLRYVAMVKAPPKPSYATVAGELLCSILRFHLAVLDSAEQAVRKGKSSNTPVRDYELLPRSVIADVADDLLQDCETWDYAPGPELISLIRELLRVDRNKKTGDREYHAKHNAAWILAQMDVGVRRLAKMVGVTPSTVSEWKKDPHFASWVERNRSTVERWKRGGTGFGPIPDEP